MKKETIIGIVSIIIILAAVASLFFQVNQVGEEVIRILAFAVIGYLFGKREEALISALKRKLE
jgi:uncharacterized membrane protein